MIRILFHKSENCPISFQCPIHHIAAFKTGFFLFLLKIHAIFRHKNIFRHDLRLRVAQISGGPATLVCCAVCLIKCTIIEQIRIVRILGSITPVHPTRNTLFTFHTIKTCLPCFHTAGKCIINDIQFFGVYYIINTPIPVFRIKMNRLLSAIYTVNCDITLIRLHHVRHIVAILMNPGLFTQHSQKLCGHIRDSGIHTGIVFFFYIGSRCFPAGVNCKCRCIAVTDRYPGTRLRIEIAVFCSDCI